MRRFLLGVVFVLLASSCGAIRFQRAWSSSTVGDGSGVEGRWKGEWRSEWNGHSGGLRCLMTRQDDGHYLAWFFSTYAGILFFQYETLFQVADAEDGTQHFVGEQDLGEMVGGVYRYEGIVDGDLFHATFRAENGDHGVFEMKRVEVEERGAGGEEEEREEQRARLEPGVPGGPESLGTSCEPGS